MVSNRLKEIITYPEDTIEIKIKCNIYIYKLYYIKERKDNG